VSDATNVSLLRRVRDPKDAASWRTFYGVYEPLLLRYARSKGLQENDARDVVAEVFVKLYRGMESFELDHARGRFRTWLYRIVANAITDWWRRQPAEARMPSSFEVGGGEDGQANVDEAWEREYQSRILQAAVEQVRREVEPTRPNAWACYEKHVLQGKPAADVGRELGMTANNVYVTASRIQKRVRTICLTEYEEDMGGGSDDNDEAGGDES
jgi:RNA polymerase sigma-70 factor (ECF subfamily)